MTSSVQMSYEDERLLEACGHIHCPNPECGLPLHEHLSFFESVVGLTDTIADACEAQGREFMCTACLHEFGDEMTLEVATERYKGEKRQYENKSTVTGAVALVHEIAASMPDARRKDVIQACVDKGIAFYTARTQYQKWFKAKKSAQGLAKR